MDHPGRFGLFASLPLPHVDLALAEIAYAYDVLRADGIGVSTNEGDIWLGDERNWPMFAELNRRKAVVFVHPAATSNCSAVSRAYGGELISSPWLEFPMNTARAILGLLAKGVTRKYPDIRFIFSHGGGAMPFLLGRIAGFTGWRTVGGETLRELFPDGIYAEFGKLYFDCAQALAPETLQLASAGCSGIASAVRQRLLLFPRWSRSVEQFSKLNSMRCPQSHWRRKRSCALSSFQVLSSPGSHEGDPQSYS